MNRFFTCQWCCTTNIAHTIYSCEIFERLWHVISKWCREKKKRWKRSKINNSIAFGTHFLWFFTWRVQVSMKAEACIAHRNSKFVKMLFFVRASLNWFVWIFNWISLPVLFFLSSLGTNICWLRLCSFRRSFFRFPLTHTHTCTSVYTNTRLQWTIEQICWVVAMFFPLAKLIYEPCAHFSSPLMPMPSHTYFSHSRNFNAEFKSCHSFVSLKTYVIKFHVIIMRFFLSFVFLW